MLFDPSKKKFPTCHPHLLGLGKQYRLCSPDQHRHATAIESGQKSIDALRRVSYLDADTNKRLSFWTNNCCSSSIDYPPQTYKCGGKWNFFFDGFKQHANQVFFVPRQRCEDSDLIAVSITAGGNRTQALGTAASLYKFLTDSQRHAFEKVARFAGSRSKLPFHDDYSKTPTRLILSTSNRTLLGRIDGADGVADSMTARMNQGALLPITFSASPQRSSGGSEIGKDTGSGAPEGDEAKHHRRGDEHRDGRTLGL